MKGKFKKILPCLLYVLLIVLLFLGLLLYMTSKWYLKYYSNVSFAQLLFTIVSPIEGTDTGFLNGFASECLPIPIVVTTVAIGITVLYNKKQLFKNKLFLNKIPYRRLITIGFSFICVLSMAIGSISLVKGMGVESYLKNTSDSSDVYETYYVDPSEVEYTFPEKKRNLIYIFLESMEVTFESKSTGGLTDTDYIPELTELQEENQTFNGGDSSYNGYYVPSLSSWTVAGIVGQTCGTPVNIDWSIKNNITDGEYLPNATSIGDILKQQGYTQEFMCGSDIEFGGRGNYLAQHGDYDIFDYTYAQENGYIDEDYGVWWGFEDDKLFTFAESELDRLSSEDDPFNLTLLTCDTHFPDGYTCSDCEDTYDSTYSNVMNCSSKKVSAFVEWCKKQSWYENTTIVIAGDHTTMDTNWFADKDTSNYTRKAYYTIINSPVTATRKDGREICTYDLFPTTLAALNVKFNSDRLAFGTNLYSDSDTLVEELGFDDFNTKIQQSSDYYTDYLFGGRDVNKDLADTGYATWDMKGGDGRETEEDLPTFFEGTYDFSTGQTYYDNTYNYYDNSSDGGEEYYDSGDNSGSANSGNQDSGGSIDTGGNVDTGGTVDTGGGVDTGGTVDTGGGVDTGGDQTGGIETIPSEG